jgi:hypothetical protein
MPGDEFTAIPDRVGNFFSLLTLTLIGHQV